MSLGEGTSPKVLAWFQISTLKTQTCTSVQPNKILKLRGLSTLECNLGTVTCDSRGHLRTYTLTLNCLIKEFLPAIFSTLPDVEASQIQLFPACFIPSDSPPHPLLCTQALLGIIQSSSLYNIGNRDPERLSNLSKATQLVRGRPSLPTLLSVLLSKNPFTALHLAEYSQCIPHQSIHHPGSQSQLLGALVKESKTGTFMHWRRKWQPTPVFLLENPRDWGVWWAAVYGVAQSWT